MRGFNPPSWFSLTPISTVKLSKILHFSGSYGTYKIYIIISSYVLYVGKFKTLCLSKRALFFEELHYTVAYIYILHTYTYIYFNYLYLRIYQKQFSWRTNHIRFVSVDIYKYILYNSHFNDIKSFKFIASF